MTTACDHRGKAKRVLIASIEAAMPMLIETRGVIDSFHSMIRKKVTNDLEPRITQASNGLMHSFAESGIRNHAALRTAITEPGSNS